VLGPTFNPTSENFLRLLFFLVFGRVRGCVPGDSALSHGLRIGIPVGSTRTQRLALMESRWGAWSDFSNQKSELFLFVGFPL
jgi:hypothetical protein